MVIVSPISFNTKKRRKEGEKSLGNHVAHQNTTNYKSKNYKSKIAEAIMGKYEEKKEKKKRGDLGYKISIITKTKVAK